MKKLLCICLLITALVFWVEQKRKFYQIENIEFTVWKRWGGTCYITPYKYWGIKPPKKNYITGPNGGGIAFFIINDTFFVCGGSSGSMPNHPFEFHLQDYQYIFINYDDNSPEEKERYKEIKEKYPNKEYPFIDIDILENYARLYHPEKGGKVLR